MRKGIALLALAILSGSTAAQDVNLARLREAARMPSVYVGFGLRINSVRGLSRVLVDDRPDLRSQIAALRKQLRGDATDADRYFRLRQLHERLEDDKGVEDAARRAVELYRRRLKATPKDPHLLTRL